MLFEKFMPNENEDAFAVAAAKAEVFGGSGKNHPWELSIELICTNFKLSLDTDLLLWFLKYDSNIAILC